MKRSVIGFTIVILAISITLDEQGQGAVGRQLPPVNVELHPSQWSSDSPPPPLPQRCYQSYIPPPPPPPQPANDAGNCLGAATTQISCLQDVVNSILMLRPYIGAQCCAAIRATHEDCLNTILDSFNNPFLASLVKQQCLQTVESEPEPELELELKPRS
ncbi:hypothetical protein V6N13_055663 [Hibiscus sabdariffa]|uniref:Prolamin-like domain-containing protein n=1 Tax=Hibiscus sabdariffa TaxID=183260 RepID=A0ABR2BM15_9ROSI